MSAPTQEPNEEHNIIQVFTHWLADRLNQNPAAPANEPPKPSTVNTDPTAEPGPEPKKLQTDRYLHIDAEAIAEHGLIKFIERVNTLISTNQLDIPSIPLPEYTGEINDTMALKLPNGETVEIYNPETWKRPGLAWGKSTYAAIEYVNYYIKPSKYAIYLNGIEDGYLLTYPEFNKYSQEFPGTVNLTKATELKYFGDPSEFPVLGLALIAELLATPNHWVDFGYKTQWIVINDPDITKVAEDLGLKDSRQTSIPGGFKALGISDAIDRSYSFAFVFKVGDWSIATANIGTRIANKLPELATKYSDVQYFSNHRVSDSMNVERYLNGQLTRRINTEGGEFVPVRSAGEETEIEKQLDLKSREDIDCEEVCLAIADAWSVDPGKLTELSDSPEPAVIGSFR